MRAVEAAADALYRDESGIERLAGRARSSDSAPSSARPDTLHAAAQRRADALALLAERALAAGFGGRADGGPAGVDPGAGAAADSVERAAPISGTRAARYQVVLHVDAETLSEDSAGATTDAAGSTAVVGGSGRSELEDGTRVYLASLDQLAERRTDALRASPAWPLVSPETSRRISCDAGLVRITHRPDGSVLGVGRRTRTIPPALRRALEARDRGCRFPGCGSRFTDAHHVKHWADGGETSLGNTLLLCNHHHALVHEGGWRVMWSGEGQPRFVDPRGGTHYDGRWKAPELLEHPVRALVEENRRRGVEPDWRTAGARWKREDDIPSDVYFRAFEAAG
jgi:hypothetical protein